tara:strand:- start:702 stop:1193 length:492 start_codon:yes stop_codon:yes gene_type:complete
MSRAKENQLIYDILIHHLNHYQEVKKIFKIDYDSQMILLTVYSHLLFQTLNPSIEQRFSEGLEWNEMFPIIKNLPKNKKKYKVKLSLFSVSQILSIPKESVRRKVINLCKKKYLEFSTKDGLTIGDNLESTVKKIAPKDMSALIRVIKSVNQIGGIEKLKKFK